MTARGISRSPRLAVAELKQDMNEIPIDKTEWMTVEQAAAHHRCDVRTVQRWITGDLIPVLQISSGKRSTYLLRRADVKRFRPPERGRPKSTE